MNSMVDVASYVGRRLLYDHCDILTLIDDSLECYYRYLIEWMERFTLQFGETVLPRLPKVKESRQELIADMSRLYSGVLCSSDNPNSAHILKALFTVTYYMMLQYKDSAVLCSSISLTFVVVTNELTSWQAIAT